MRIALLTACLLPPAMIVGCNRSPYELGLVRGTVTIDGEPLAGGRVMFAPISQGDSRGAGKPAFGTLQSDGKYVLTTYHDGDGAIVGEHWVTIFGPKEEVQSPTSSRPAKRPTAFRRFVVRQKQSVAAGQTNEINIRLTSREIAKFTVRDDG